jgi:hypothetical protein
VRDVLVDPEAAAYLEERGVFVTPVLAVDQELVVGFQRARIDSLLGLGEPPAGA